MACRAPKPARGRKGTNQAQRRTDGTSKPPWVKMKKHVLTSRGKRHWLTCLKGVRDCSYTILCLGPNMQQAARPAPPLPTASMASSPPCSTTLCCRQCRGRRCKSCRHTSSDWAGPSPGLPRLAPTSILTSKSRIHPSSRTKASNTTIGVSPSSSGGLARRVADGSGGFICCRIWNGYCHLPSGETRYEYFLFGKWGGLPQLFYLFPRA